MLVSIKLYFSTAASHSQCTSLTYELFMSEHSPTTTLSLFYLHMISFIRPSTLLFFFSSSPFLLHNTLPFFFVRDYTSKRGRPGNKANYPLEQLFPLCLILKSNIYRAISSVRLIVNDTVFDVPYFWMG